MRSAFDDYSSTYETAVAEAIAFAGQPHDVYVEAKARKLLHLAGSRVPLASAQALDVGCGLGLIDSYLLPHVGSLHGVDVSPSMVEQARARNPRAEYRVYDGSRLPYDDARFDLVFLVCVLHHVSPAKRPSLLRELRRVTAGQGLLVVFEHNPWNPLTRKVVRSCSFDEGAELLPRRRLSRGLRDAGLEIVATEYLLFFPWRTRLLEAGERVLAQVPLGAQYVVAASPPR